KPWLMRGRHGAELSLFADFPLGLFPGVDFRMQTFGLEPGDRLVLMSDGVLEATDPSGEEFGQDRFAQLLAATRGFPPPEVVRQVTRAVLEHRQVELRDDATVVCLDWRGR